MLGALLPETDYLVPPLIATTVKADEAMCENVKYDKAKVLAMAELAPMPLLPITSQRTVDLCASLPLRSSDVFICSYPKSGTTWTQHIVLSLLVRSTSKKLTNDEDRQNLDYQHVSEYAPFFEIDQHWDAESNDLIASVKVNQDRLGRRVFNTHLRWDMLPKKMASTPNGNSQERKSKSKFIYLIRSPMDVCLSFYCHLSNQKEGGYEGDFEDFFNEWIEGKIAFGSYIDHVCSFATAFAETSDTCDVLLLSYEEMLSDLQAAVSKVARFIEADVTDDDIKELFE